MTINFAEGGGKVIQKIEKRFSEVEIILKIRFAYSSVDAQPSSLNCATFFVEQRSFFARK